MVPLRSLASALIPALLAGVASAELPLRDDRLPLGDLIEIVAQGDELLAVDAEGGGTTSVRLHLGERVLWHDVRGLVAVALTDERVLAVAVGSGSWQEAPYERGDEAPTSALLGDRVALVPLGRRVLGFVERGSFVQVRLGPQEDLRALRVGANVAVLVTDRHAHGLSPTAGGFFPIRLQLRESLEGVEAKSNVATVRTDQRVLVFRGPTGTWAERRD